MRLKLYRGANMPDAMAKVRADLGADALILGTRRVSDGIEVTAALEDADSSPVLALDDVVSAIKQGVVPLARRRVEPRAAVAAEPPVDHARVAALSYHGVPPDIAAKLGQGDFEAALTKTLPFGVLPLGPEARPLLLTGPPGAGKTLTVARLATRLVMGRINPLVITADGKRAGATEQLAAFTKLLGIGLVLASHPVTLGRALTKRQDGAPVLIDSAGTDPFDPEQAEAFRATLSAAGAVGVLVLPAGLDPSEAAETAVAFAEAGASLLVVTRLDLARRLGSVLAAAGAARLPLTEAGVGPGAADGLVPLTPALLANRLMQTGTPRHASHTA